jgi:hypothetical protein
MMPRLVLSLAATLFAANALAQTPTDQTSTDQAAAPVAYVYVSRPTHIDGFAVAADGKLTPVSGSPFANIAVAHMSVTKNFLFGSADNQTEIDTFSIESDGALRQVAVTDAHQFAPEYYSAGPTQIDYTGSTLYNYVVIDGSGSYIQSYKIESSGDLEYLSTIDTDNSFDIQETAPTMIRFAGANKYAYETGCDSDALNPATEAFKRESNGELEYVGVPKAMPAPPNSEDVYCPWQLAGDPTDHFAFALQAFNTVTGNPDGPPSLASYTVESNGNLTTSSTYENMPADNNSSVMSISPTGKLLASGANGFELYHFNGSDPITPYSDKLQASAVIQEFGWDKDNHLFVLSSSQLFVYTVTPASITQAPGSPYSIPEASSVIVLSLK